MRVWTLQGYIVANNFIFYCGKERIDRDRLNTPTTAIHLCKDKQKKILAACLKQLGFGAGYRIGNFRPLSAMGTTPDTYTTRQVKGSLSALFSDDLPLLACRGFLVDYVDGVGGLNVIHRDRDGNEPDWEVTHNCVDSTSPVNIAPRTSLPSSTRDSSSTLSDS